MSICSLYHAVQGGKGDAATAKMQKGMRPPKILSFWRAGRFKLFRDSDDGRGIRSYSAHGFGKPHPRGVRSADGCSAPHRSADLRLRPQKIGRGAGKRRDAAYRRRMLLCLQPDSRLLSKMPSGYKACFLDTAFGKRRKNYENRSHNRKWKRLSALWKM